MYNDELQNNIVENFTSNGQRHFLAVFFLSFLWGTFGIDRFYLGKYWTGLLKLLTLGGFGMWTIADLTMIISGSMRDKQGNNMLEAEKYKRFAKKTVSLFTLAALLLIVLTAISTYYAVHQFIQSGGINSLIPDMSDKTINLDQLKALNINL